MTSGRTTSGGKAADFDLLLELGEIFENLRRLRHDSATGSRDLRHHRSRVMHLEALLRADSIALAPRKTVAPDRGAPDVLDDVLPGAPQARASANDNAARGSERLTPFLERLSRATTALERRAEELRAKLSPATAQLLDTLAKRHVSPPIATLGDSACGQCNVRVPTALANAIISDSTMHRCPHCKRILVRAASNELPSASP